MQIIVTNEKKWNLPPHPWILVMASVLITRNLQIFKHHLSSLFRVYLDAINFWLQAIYCTIKIWS